MTTIGIIGCGKHVLYAHALPCREHDGFELKSIYDISAKQMADFEDLYGKPLQKFTSKDEFFKSIDAVIISTPDQYHYADLVASVNAGKHVFVEKPIVTNSKDLSDLTTTLQKAKENNLIISTCHPRRYDAQFIWVKNNMHALKEELGNVLSFDYDFSYHKPTKDWKHDRGLLLDHINHEVDLMHFILEYDNFNARKIADSYDYYHAVGQRIDGVTFEFKGSRRLETRKYIETLKMRFCKGEVNVRNGEIIIDNHDTEKRNLYVAPTNYNLRGQMTIKNFIQCINGKEQCYISQNDLYINNAAGVILTENKYMESKI